MGAMVWWLIPLVATVLAIAWLTWWNRPRPPADTHDSLQEHERFKQAMDKQTSQQPKPRGTREPRTPPDDQDAS
jgi:hypothetical protein